MSSVGIISVRFTNLYKNPLVDGNITACLCRGTEVEIIGMVGQFYKVRCGDNESYVPIRCIRTGKEKR